MKDQIGKTAGIIWTHLKKNGTQSLAALTTGTKVDKNLLHWGIGWLAREGKLKIEKDKGKYTVSLNE